MDYHFRQLIEIPEHMTQTFFELPCVVSAEKFPETQHIIWHFNNVLDYSFRHMDDKEWMRKAMWGAVAEDYDGQWWHLDPDELEDYVEMQGLAYESMR